MTARTLNPQVVKETLAELGIKPSSYVVEDRGRRLSLINTRGEHRLVDLKLNVGETDNHVIARIGKACACEVPAFLDV